MRFRSMFLCHGRQVSWGLLLALLFSGTLTFGQDRQQCNAPTHTEIDDYCGDLGGPRVRSANFVTTRSFFFEDTPALPITNATVSDTLFITDPSCGVIEDVNLSLDITHPFVGDLEVTLTSSTGTSVFVLDNQGGTTNNVDVIFDDEGASDDNENTTGRYIS